MTLTFHRYGSKATTDTLELDETKSSIIDKLSEPTRLSAILTTTTAPQIALGNYTTYEGTRYYVTKEPTVRKEHSQLYTVEVDLERSLGLARITILANPVDHRTTFDYTATATEHLQLIVDALNAKFGEVGLKWTRGAVHCKDTVKHIKYDGTTVLGALQQIRETYETDIFADGETLSLGQTDDKTSALPLAYGKGKGLLSGLERHKHTDDTVPTRLYVTGTKRNMTTGRLTLQRGVVLAVDRKSGAIERHSGDLSAVADERTFYRTDKEGQYIAEWSPMDKFKMWETRFPTEATYTNEEIYPSHVSTIKSVTKVKDHYEVNSDFNYTPLRIDGEQMQVVFQSGNLAGRDFDAKYLASTNRLAIVPKEEDDTTLPNDTLCPKVGDQYIVTGIKLPDEYIREAERNLTDEALRHLIKLQETRYSYKADIDPVYLHDHHSSIAHQLAVGRYVHLTDPQITIGDPYVRIVGKRTYLDRPYTPEIELSNEVEPRSELTRVLNELDRQDDGLISILDRLRQSGLTLGELTEGVGELTLSAEEMRKRLETAEGSLAGKLDSGVFEQWQEGEFKQALASELATSAQQTLAEALKQAGEMDKKVTEETNQAVSKLTASWQDVDQRVGNIYQWAAEKSSEMDSLTKWQRETAPEITDLSSRALTLQQKQDLGLLTSALRLKMAGGEGNKKTLEGLTLLKYIALSGDNKTVSAYLASDTLGAVLKAGITGFGTPNEREQVEITHQGTGHFGNLYFTGSQIDFRTSRDADPYLSMGAEENQFITEFLATARQDDTPVSVGTVTLSEGSKVYEQTVSAEHDGTRLTVVIDQLEVNLYDVAKARLLLDGEEFGSWKGAIRLTPGGGSILNGVPDFREEKVPYKGSNLSYERVVKAGSHTLRLEIAGKMGSGDSGATIKGLCIKRRYDTGRQQSAFAKNGLRLFGSPDRYFDVDYREKYSKVVRYYYGLPITEFVPNPYLVRIKGGLQVDELDMPGVPLCGASFNENGTQTRAFGKRAKRRGQDIAQAVYDYNINALKVYHSIGNTNYIPIVQVSGWDSGDINWSLTPRVYEVKSDYFVVRILTNHDNPVNTAISYVAHKTE